MGTDLDAPRDYAQAISDLAQKVAEQTVAIESLRHAVLSLASPQKNRRIASFPDAAKILTAMLSFRFEERSRVVSVCEALSESENDYNRLGHRGLIWISTVQGPRTGRSWLHRALFVCMPAGRRLVLALSETEFHDLSAKACRNSLLEIKDSFPLQSRWNGLRTRGVSIPLTAFLEIEKKVLECDQKC